MTTPAKKYQNVSYKELMEYAAQNPNRNTELTPIELPSSVQETSLDSIGLQGYTSCQLDPANILSVLACIHNPVEYALAPKHIRLQHIIDLSTTLQQRTEELRGSHLLRKRKKIHDLIAMAYNGTQLDMKESYELYQGVSHLEKVHFILLNEAVKDHDDEEKNEDGIKGAIAFSSDPIVWSKENPLWIVDLRGRWVALPSETSARPIQQFVDQWLTEMEQKGWIIMWPEIDAKKEDLVTELSSYPSWKENDRKLTKDHLAARLSRFKTIHALSSLI